MTAFIKLTTTGASGNRIYAAAGNPKYTRAVEITKFSAVTADISRHIRFVSFIFTVHGTLYSTK